MTRQHSPTITTFSEAALGLVTIASGAEHTAGSVAAWPTANKAFFIPFTLGVADTCRNAMTVVGLVAPTGHFDIGVYDRATGTRQCSTGSTVTPAGFGPIQPVPTMTAATLLPAGDYWLAMATDSTTDTYWRSVRFPAQVWDNFYGVKEQTACFPLPANVAPVAITTTYVPNFGVSFVAFS